MKFKLIPGKPERLRMVGSVAWEGLWPGTDRMSAYYLEPIAFLAVPGGTYCGCVLACHQRYLSSERPQRPRRDVFSERCASRRFCGSIQKHSDHVPRPRPSSRIILTPILTSPTSRRVRHAQSSDLKDIGNSDLAVRAALVDQVRDACMNVGFLYGQYVASIHALSERASH